MKGSLLPTMVESNFLRAVYTACRQVPVLGTCSQRIALKVFPRGTRIWIQIPRGEGTGLWFYVDPRFEPGYCCGDYEPWLQDFLVKTLKERDCFYDVGAHTGFSALIAARIVGERGAVIALEPDPRNAAVVRANAARNGMPQIEVVEAAAWSSGGEATFKLDGEASNRSQGRVVLAGTAGSQQVKVRAVSLDELVFGRQGRPPGLVKLDVEGAEGEVLKGATRTLRELKPIVLCEVHNPDMLDPLRAFLTEFGYSLNYWTAAYHDNPRLRQHYLCAQALR